MPQMAPISWLTLFMLFSLLYVLYAILNYFSTPPSPSTQEMNKTSLKTNPFNWKW